MAPRTPTPRRTPNNRRRVRPPSENGSPVKVATVPPTLPAPAATEPPPKKRKYIPGGAGGGGRFVEIDDIEPSRLATTPSLKRKKTTTSSRAATTQTPRPKREHTMRRRAMSNPPDDMRFSSAAAVAAAVVQNEGYKPREERGWEEFHPNLDIDATFMVFRSEDVDGTSALLRPVTPSTADPATPARNGSPMTVNGVNLDLDPQLAASLGLLPGTTPKRRVGRPPRDPLAFYAARVAEGLGTPKAPTVLPIYNQTPKERLDLKRPQYRKTDRILLFESKKFGQARYVDKSMMNVGYQESDIFIRPEPRLIKTNDTVVDEDSEQAGAANKPTRTDVPQSMGGILGRVEYDMDEQDDVWLEAYNAERRRNELEPITREVFEIAVTKIEREWYALEKRIPKPNPKPPQTHRPRSSSAAAVNGEPSTGEEQDSLCAICDDGDCENTNAIVFCDGCDLAVHQECYGVPFIPEGQWLCRKCQLIGRGVPTCIFCPNTDGAFKQTNSSKWSHLLCAMWIPEVSLGNHTFMEPVMDVEKVPKTRWKLTCYLCNQKMGACIQCGNKACYQAFHVTCARRAKLYLKMKNSQGALSVLDGSMVLKAFCDKHCPPDYTTENCVEEATRQAKRFYKRTMKGLIWADNQTAANTLAASHRHAVTEHPPDESQQAGDKIAAAGGDKKKGQPAKPVWKLPSGAPIIPQAVFDIVESSLQRFTIRKRKEFVAEACKFWTLKRESRRGAALLKRLQLQMETFSSVELTRRNFASMGPAGKARLARRIQFAESLVKDLEQLKSMAGDIVEREAGKLEAGELEQEFVDRCYFPIAMLLPPAVDKALGLDKNVFRKGLLSLQVKVSQRFYTATLDFARDLCEVVREGINTQVPAPVSAAASLVPDPVNPGNPKQTYNEPRERKKLGKRILKAIQPQLELALQAETSITSGPLEKLIKELDGMFEACVEIQQPSITVSQRPSAVGVQEQEVQEQEQDTIMAEAPATQITVAGQAVDGISVAIGSLGEAADVMDTTEDTSVPQDDIKPSVETSDATPTSLPNGTPVEAPVLSPESQTAVAQKDSDTPAANGIDRSNTPPATNGYVAIPKPGQPTPPTPPRSMDIGKESLDPLADGGVPWYLKEFGVVGTSVLEPEPEPESEPEPVPESEPEQEEAEGEEETGDASGEQDRARSPSEELTDLDDAELKELAIDMEAGSNINASSPLAPAPAKARSSPVRTRTRSSARKR